MDPGCDPIAYPMTLNASVKLSKPSFFKPSESYFERYRPANMSLSLATTGGEFGAMVFRAVGRSAMGQSAEPCGEVPPVVRCERANHVLQNDNARNPAKADHASHQLPKRLERSAAPPRQSSTISRQR